MVFLIPVIGISSNGFSGATNLPAFDGACPSAFLVYGAFGFYDDFWTSCWTSCSIILPPGPDPFTPWRLKLFSLATLLANGLAIILSPDCADWDDCLLYFTYSDFDYYLAYFFSAFYSFGSSDFSSLSSFFSYFFYFYYFFSYFFGFYF